MSKPKSNIRCASLVLFVSATLLCISVKAHLMVAQHGTLNFLDDGVYMVLSLPASAFEDADEDSDGHLSLVEFSKHRTEIIDKVAKHVTLSDQSRELPLSGIMISPVTPHDAPKEPADQIIVMGKYILPAVVLATVKNDNKTAIESGDNKLRFHVGLFGSDSHDQELEITATRKSEDKKQVFELSPEKNTVKLNFN